MSVNEDEDEDEDFVWWLVCVMKDDGVVMCIVLIECGCVFGMCGVEVVWDLVLGEMLLCVFWGLVVESVSASGDDDGDDDARWLFVMVMMFLEELSEGELNECVVWLM